MDIKEAINIHFKNVMFGATHKFTPAGINAVAVLQDTVTDLMDKNVFDFDEMWYMRELNPSLFLQYLAIDALNNITRRDPAEALPENITEEQIDKIPYTTKYEEVARLALNLMGRS